MIADDKGLFCYQESFSDSFRNCFFHALDGFLHIWSGRQNAHTSGKLLFPHISGLFCLHPNVCFSVSSEVNGALKGIVNSLLLILSPLSVKFFLINRYNPV